MRTRRGSCAYACTSAHNEHAATNNCFKCALLLLAQGNQQLLQQLQQHQQQQHQQQEQQHQQKQDSSASGLVRLFILSCLLLSCTTIEVHYAPCCIHLRHLGFM